MIHYIVDTWFLQYISVVGCGGFFENINMFCGIANDLCCIDLKLNSSHHILSRIWHCSSLCNSVMYWIML